jgi:hypothetical protein
MEREDLRKLAEKEVEEDTDYAAYRAGCIITLAILELVKAIEEK